MEQVPVTGPNDPLAKNVGHLSNGPSVWMARSTPNDPRPNSTIPAIVDFDEANGGEWRKSFHGYPYVNLCDAITSKHWPPLNISPQAHSCRKRFIESSLTLTLTQQARLCSAGGLARWISDRTDAD